MFNLWFSPSPASNDPGNGLRCIKRPGASKYLAVDDEAGALGDLVVQRLRGVVGLVRLPVNARHARLARLLVDLADQRPANSLSARGSIGEEILQVTNRRDRGGRAMEEIMHQPHQLLAAFGDQR